MVATHDTVSTPLASHKHHSEQKYYKTDLTTNSLIHLHNLLNPIEIESCRAASPTVNMISGLAQRIHEFLEHACIYRP